MSILTTALILCFILPIAADQATPTIFPMETISCSANGDLSANCNQWRGRMKEEGHTAVQCHDAKDHAGRAMWACSPRWIKLYRRSEKRIFASYKITKTKNDEHQLHVILDYPETKLADILVPIIILAVLILLCSCSPPPPPSRSSSDSGLSFGDIFLASSLANSFNDSGSSGPEWGGSDYSYKSD